MDAKAYLGGSRADSSSPSKALSVLERAQLQLRGEKLSRATSARTISSTRLQVDDATGYPGSATSSAPSRGLRGAKPVYLDDDSDALGDSISITPSESSLDSSDEELEEYLSRLGNAAKEPSGGSKKPKSHAASATTSKTSLATTAASAYLKRPVSHQSKLDDASTPTRSTSVPPTSSPYLKTKETSQSHESVAQQRPTYLKAMKSFSTIKSSVEIGDDARFLEQPQAPKDTAERSANSSTPGAGHGQSESTSDTDDGSSIGSDFERFMGTGVAKDAAMSPKAASEPVEKETIETKYGLSSDSDLQSSPISISVSAAQVDPAIQTTPTAIASETGLKVPGPTSVSLQASSVTSHVGGRAADGVAGTGFTPDLHSQSTLRGATTASSTLATLNAHTGPSPAITTVAQPVPVNAVIPSNSNTRSAVLSPVQRDASPTPYKPTRSSEPKPHAAQIENESQVRPAEAPPNMDENSDSAALRKFGLLTLQDLDNPKSESVSGSSSLASNPESESIEGISLGKQAHSSIPRPESLGTSNSSSRQHSKHDKRHPQSHASQPRLDSTKQRKDASRTPSSEGAHSQTPRTNTAPPPGSADSPGRPYPESIPAQPPGYPPYPPYMYPYMPMPFYPTAFQPTMPPPTQYQNWTLPTHSPQPQYRAPPAASSSRGPAFFHDGAPTGLGAECHLCSTCPCGYYGHSCHPGHCHVCEHSHSHQTSHSHSRRCSECRRRRKKKHRNARSESSPSNSASQQESRSKRSSKGKGKVVSPTPSADEDSIVEEIIGAPDSHSQSESQELPVQDRNDPPRRTLPSEPESSKSQELRGCHERRYRCSTCSHHGRSDRPSKQQQHSTGSSPQHYQSYIEHAQSTSLLGDDSLSLIATFHPNIFVLNNLLASHLRLIQDFVKMNQKLNEDEQNASHYVRYTTLEDTKREIESRRKPELTFEEALEQVKRDS